MPNRSKVTVRSLSERFAEGKALRDRVPRSAHSQFACAADRPEPVALLESSNRGRVQALIPLRYERMAPTPFTFLRGSAAAMAFDLASTPTTGINVQLCGDCHVMNFGCFGTPERNFIFDLTDFDETIPGPWEWDVKRLAASVIAGGRAIGIGEKDCTLAAEACVGSYRANMRMFARMDVLDVWYTKIDGHQVLDLMSRCGQRRPTHVGVDKGGPHRVEQQFPKLIEIVDGQRRFRDQPPVVFHPPRGGQFEEQMHRFLARYRDTLAGDRRPLLDRYRMVDLAMKVVGVGSVGTRCAIVLMLASEQDPLILQYKEADRSVLEPYVAKSEFSSGGKRRGKRSTAVAIGQRPVFGLGTRRRRARFLLSAASRHENNRAR